MSTAIGLTLNNPANLEDFGIPWKGLVGTHGKLCQFDTLHNGIRAACENLRNQQRLHDLNTVSEIITKLSPPNENDTAAYISTVCNWMDVYANEQLNLENNAQLGLLSQCVFHEEVGEIIPMEDILDAIADI